MTEMAMGANVPLETRALRATLWWTPGSDVPDVDASALLLGADGRVASDEDFVFYNQPADPAGTVRYIGKVELGGQNAAGVELDLDRIPAAVARILIAASADDGTLGAVPGLMLQVADRISGASAAVFRMAATTEQAFICGEVYRFGDGWKFRAVGQGYATGLAGLAADFGIQVDDDAAEAPPAEAPPAEAPPVVAATVEAPPVDVVPAPPVDAATVEAPPVEAAPVVVAPAEAAAAVAAPIEAVPVEAVPVEAVPVEAVPLAPAPPVDVVPAPPVEPAAVPAPPPAPPVEPAAVPEPPAPPAAPPAPPVEAVAVPEPPAPPAQAAPTGAGLGGPLTAASLPTPMGSVLTRNDRVAIAAPDGRPIPRLFVGLGWMSAPGAEVDLDASAIAFDHAGKRDELIGRRNAQAYHGALSHLGDSRSGSMTGDAEVILIDLPRIPANVGAIVIAINSFSGQRFTAIANAYLRIGDAQTGQELARFNLTDTQPSTAVLMASIRRDPTTGWQLRAIGEFHDTRFVRNLIDFAARHALTAP